MLYISMDKQFNKPISTHIAASILGVQRETVYKWGESGKIRMIRDENGNRIYDEEELKMLAPKINKKRMRGFALFPSKKKPKK